jgi:hypothetical protein
VAETEGKYTGTAHKPDPGASGRGAASAGVLLLFPLLFVLILADERMVQQFVALRPLLRVEHGALMDEVGQLSEFVQVVLRGPVSAAVAQQVEEVAAGLVAVADLGDQLAARDRVALPPLEHAVGVEVLGAELRAHQHLLGEATLHVLNRLQHRIVVAAAEQDATRVQLEQAATNGPEQHTQKQPQSHSANGEVERSLDPRLSDLSSVRLRLTWQPSRRAADWQWVAGYWLLAAGYWSCRLTRGRPARCI